MKTKRQFISPHVKVAETDLEGLICTSGFKTMQVDQLHNINADAAAMEAEELYFEF